MASGYSVDMATGANLNVAGNVSAGNLTFMRNKVINGDARIDQRNAGAPTGVTGYGVDRFKTVSNYGIGGVVQQQVALAAADVAATGGQTFATKLSARGLSSGMAVYLPFDGSTVDCSETPATTTMTGGVTYVTGAIGQALYLANEANVLATPTHAANYLTRAFTQSTPLTVSCWVQFLKMPFSAQTSMVWTVGAANVFGLMLAADYVSTTSANLRVGIASVGNTTMSAVNLNTWYHCVATYTPSSRFEFYLNGALIGAVTASVPASLANNGQLTLGDGGSTNTSNTPFSGYIDDFRIYNRVLTASEIALLYTNSLHATVPSPTLYLPFEGTAGATIANGTTIVDATGTYTATVTSSGSPAASYVASGYVVGSTTALYLPNEANVLATSTRASKYVTVPYTVSTSITVSCWMLITKLPQASGQFSTIFAFGSASSATFHIYANYVSATSASLIVIYEGYQQTTPGYTISTNTWYHVVAICIPSTSITLYVNSQHYNTINAGFPATLTTNGQLTIGDFSTSGTVYRPFAGYIDDFRVYNTALSAAQIATLYGQTAPLYTLWQQPIESFNISDLAWGTTAAQPATLSCWVKNNTATAQRFALSANNSGASTGLIAYMPFDGDFADRVGTTLTSAVFTGTPTYGTTAGIYKVGISSLNLTANTAGGTPTTYPTYTIAPTITAPLTMCGWFYATALGASNVVVTIGGSGGANGNRLQVLSSGAVYSIVYYNSTYSSGTSATGLVTTNTWYHFAVVFGASVTNVFLNGQLVHSYSSSAGVSALDYVSYLRIGAGGDASAAFAGYIDDVRIYSRALTAAQIAQLYANNVSSTTASTYLAVPRSIVYPSPSISAGSWTKVAFTLPADTIGTWFNADNGAGVLLSLCLGASGTFATSNVAAIANNAVTVWNSVPEYTATNVQVFGGSASNFLAAAGNSILITGVQFEKGSVATPYEARPLAMEMLACQRYYEKSYALNVPPGTGITNGLYRVVAGANVGLFITIKSIIKRSIPSIYTWTQYGVGGLGSSARVETNTAGTSTPTITYVTEGSFTIYYNAASDMFFLWASEAEL